MSFDKFLENLVSSSVKEFDMNFKKTKYIVMYDLSRSLNNLTESFEIDELKPLHQVKPIDEAIDLVRKNKGSFFK